MTDLVFGWPTDQLTDDPRLAYNSMSKTFCRQVYESLLDVEPSTGELTPWLATAWRYRDPVTLQLTIRTDRSFSDGTPLTPESVAASFAEVMTLRHVSPLPAAVTALAGLDRIETGSNTVTFHFARHNAAFLRSLTSVNLAISKPAADTRLGTGRWKADGAVLTDGVRRVAFRKAGSGELYAGHVIGHTLAELHNPGISYGLCPNASRGPLTDSRVRRALSLLIDRGALQSILQPTGYTVATSVLTPSTLYYQDSQLKYDPDTARRLLDAANAGRLSFEVVFNSTFSPIDAELLAAVAAQWAEHGVELRLADVDFPELRARQLDGEYDFRFFYFTGGDPDALRYQFAFSQRNMNRRNVPDELDTLLDAQLTAADPAARRELVHDIQRHITETGLWLPICNVRTVASYRPGLTGVYLDTEALTRIP
ncbi:peptide/nickel transport system substrate-binding protein [Mycobacterium sp. MAA66]|uniref:ABC transporter substrate-binding protein n=1 Tax=Mycobacterium sp. MAA66 TaxID=3156297 RepID=UPI0035163485